MPRRRNDAQGHPKEPPMSQERSNVDYEIYSPGRTRYSVSGKIGSDQAFLSSDANIHRSPEHYLTPVDLSHLKTGVQSNAKGWTRKKPDASTCYVLRHHDGREYVLAEGRSNSIIAMNKTNLTKYDMRNLKNRTTNTSKGWHVEKWPTKDEGQSSRAEAGTAIEQLLEQQLTTDRQIFIPEQAGSLVDALERRQQGPSSSSPYRSARVTTLYETYQNAERHNVERLLTPSESDED